MKRKPVALGATATAAAGVLTLIALSFPPGAGADPNLPRVAPEKLVKSVMRSETPALSGTVEVNNALGMPALPGAGSLPPMLSDGTSTLQVWADGQGRHRVSVPSRQGEMTVVDDGSTIWLWDSAERKTVESTAKGHQRPGHHESADPGAAARQIVDRLRQSCEVRVDGTATVAGRDAYELVLTPKPTERTVLREVRVAVDAEKRMPLAVTVNTYGSDSPALSVRFTELKLAKPDAGLFRFTAPAGTEVSGPRKTPDRSHAPTTVGDGWDTVVGTNVPKDSAKPQRDPSAIARQVGKPVSGPWGNGWLVSTKAGSALLTSDGRVAVGAVPQQVLTEAIGQAR